MSENEDPPGGYRLLLVPTANIEQTEANQRAGKAYVIRDQHSPVSMGPFDLVDVVTTDRCRFSPHGCPTERDRDLLSHAQAMDYALTHVRLLVLQAQARHLDAQAGDVMVPADRLLQALNQPYRFPLPGDAEALAAYRKVFEEGNLAILHLAGCDRCTTVGYDRDTCSGYEAAAREDARLALREAGRNAARTVHEWSARMMGL